MHELFLTSANGVQGADVEQNLKIFQGLCGMAPVHQFERILTFEGPDSGLLLSIPPNYLDRTRTQKWEAYAQLNKQLARQSYYINVGYIVDEDDFLASVSEGDADGAQGSKKR